MAQARWILAEVMGTATVGTEERGLNVNVEQAKAFVRNVRLNGGATASTHGEELPEDGYMVGGVVRERVLIPEYFTWNAVKCFAAEYAEELSRDTVYLGAWQNPDTGHWHLDVSEWHPRLAEATHVALGRGEIAIWDIKANTSILI